MVDIKREDITLQDWTKGISADEFAWGSYFYSEWIQTGYSTKWFRLWQYIEVNNLNERTQGYPIAACACKGSVLSNSPNMIFFTKDNRVEMEGSLNGSTYGEWGDAWGGAIYNFPVYYTRNFTWGIVYGTYALIFNDNDAAFKIDFTKIYDPSYQNITNPRFENSAAWRTVGTGRTLTDDGMEHTTGETGTLSQSVTWHDNGFDRYAIKIVGCTTGNVTLTRDNGNDTQTIITTESWRNWRFVGSHLGRDYAATMTITPSSDFDGIVEAVNLGYYKDSAYDEISGLTKADKKIAIERGGDIYITAWNKIDIISTVDRTKSDTKELVREDEEIVALTQQADSLIIWTTNWMDSRQYYWNWVDSVATEVIEWRGQIIKWAVGTEIVTYVLAWAGGASSWNAYRLYSVSWYQRSLIASNAYKVEWNQWNLDHYHPSKKFAFNDVDGSHSMCMYMDNLYIPWCDWIYQYGQTIPWLSTSWSRPLNYQNGASKLFVYQNWASLGFAYTYNQRNYYAIAYNDNYNYYGYLVTDSLYRDKLWTRKALEKIKLSYKSLASEDWKINVYMIVDDDYFWRFDVTWITNRPAIGDIYEVANDTTAEVIRIDKSSTTAGTITFRTIDNGWSLTTADRYLARVTWSGDASIDTNNNYDNMCFIKSIETDKQEYWADFIFWKDFVNNYIPFRHKIQFVIELVKNNTESNRKRTPEIYELSFVSDITDTIL